MCPDATTGSAPAPLSQRLCALTYQVPPDGLRTIAALVVLRDKVIKPLLAGTAQPKMGRKPKT